MLFFIDCVTNSNNETMTVTVNLDNTPVVMEVDTVATLSIMSYSTFRSTWPRDRTADLKDAEARLRTYTGEKITEKGALDMKVSYENQKAELTLTIVDGAGPTLLGRDWLRHLRLNWSTLNHIRNKDRSELQTLLNTHSALLLKAWGKSREPRLDCTSRKGEDLDSTVLVKYPTR